MAHDWRWAELGIVRRSHRTHLHRHRTIALPRQTHLTREQKATALSAYGLQCLRTETPQGSFAEDHRFSLRSGQPVCDIKKTLYVLMRPQYHTSNSLGLTYTTRGPVPEPHAQVLSVRLHTKTYMQGACPPRPTTK